MKLEKSSKGSRFNHQLSVLSTRFHATFKNGRKNATQLHEAGVKFEVGPRKCYFDIKFEKRVLKIPSIELNDMTEIVTRNIMALEQTRSIENAYFTDYFFFMDLLINTKNDVDLLCDKKILVNHLGDNNAATLMINNLNEGIVWAAMRDDYIKICKELNSFYEQRARHKWMAVLKRDFFSTPSAAASTIITIVVITVLTFFFFFLDGKRRVLFK